MDSLRGHLLIAPPHLTDPNFARTVVLMIQHDGEGAFGVVLNRPTEQSIRDVWAQLRGTPCACAQTIHVGGPVAGPLVALHTESSLAEIEVVPGVYCCTSAEQLEEVVRQDPPGVRFYAGYAGWGGGQLEGELQTGSWLTVPASIDVVFDRNHAELWRKVFRAASNTDKYPASPPSDPGDPSMN